MIFMIDFLFTSDDLSHVFILVSSDNGVNIKIFPNKFRWTFYQIIIDFMLLTNSTEKGSCRKNILRKCEPETQVKAKFYRW